MWLDHWVFLFFSIAAFLSVLANIGNKDKQAFGAIVGLFLATSILVPDVLTDSEIHAVGIAYDAIIMTCLYSLGCKEYQKLILVYPALMANEWLMLLSHNYFGGVYFAYGQVVTWLLYSVLIAGIYIRSDHGSDDHRRTVDGLRRSDNRRRYHA